MVGSGSCPGTASISMNSSRCCRISAPTSPFPGAGLPAPRYCPEDPPSGERHSPRAEMLPDRGVAAFPLRQGASRLTGCATWWGCSTPAFMISSRRSPRRSAPTMSRANRASASSMRCSSPTHSGIRCAIPASSAPARAINSRIHYHYPSAADLEEILALRTFRDFGGGSLYVDSFGFIDQNPHNTMHIWTGGFNPTFRSRHPPRRWPTAIAASASPGASSTSARTFIPSRPPATCCATSLPPMIRSSGRSTQYRPAVVELAAGPSRSAAGRSRFRADAVELFRCATRSTCGPASAMNMCRGGAHHPGRALQPRWGRFVSAPGLGAGDAVGKGLPLGRGAARTACRNCRAPASSASS